jgi:phage terminase large subunit GpA-like protein
LSLYKLAPAVLAGEYTKRRKSRLKKKPTVQLDADARALVFDYANAGARPDAVLSVSEWADAHRVLVSSGSAEPGRWRTDRTPYLRAIMDALTAGSAYHTVVLCKASQIGASEMAVNFLGYIADITPGPALYLMPTLDAAKEFSKIRISPMVDATPTLRAKVKDARTRDSGNTTLLKEFLGGYWALTGANSAVGLRSKPIRFLIADEVSAYTKSSDGEGSPLKLALARTRTYGNRKKVFIASTPTVAGECQIEKEFEETDKRFFYVPCPHCGGAQVLNWQGVKWENNDPETAYYECEKCAGKIYNHHKTEMLELGAWSATEKAKDPGVVGFHVSALYSPVGWYSWSDAVRDFLDAKENPEKLQVFINTILGEVWVDRADAPDWQVIYARREQYAIGTAPARTLVVTAAADVQKDRIEVLIQGWAKNLEQFTIDYIVLMGDTTQESVWDRLDATIAKTIPHESGAELPLRAVAVDSGYLTTRVYAWARKHRSDFLYVVKGVSSDLPVGQPRLVDLNWQGKRITNGARFWPVGVNTLKREIYTRLRLPLTDAGEYPDGYMHFPELPPDFFKQITAESLQSAARGAKKAWKKHYDRNEGLDLLVYNRALAVILGLDRLRDSEWATLENRLGPVMSAAQQQTAGRARPPARRVISRGIDL